MSTEKGIFPEKSLCMILGWASSSTLLSVARYSKWLNRLANPRIYHYVYPKRENYFDIDACRDWQRAESAPDAGSNMLSELTQIHNLACFDHTVRTLAYLRSKAICTGIGLDTRRFLKNIRLSAISCLFSNLYSNDCTRYLGNENRFLVTNCVWIGV